VSITVMTFAFILNDPGRYQGLHRRQCSRQRARTSKPYPTRDRRGKQGSSCSFGRRFAHSLLLIHGFYLCPPRPLLVFVVLACPFVIAAVLRLPEAAT